MFVTNIKTQNFFKIFANYELHKHFILTIILKELRKLIYHGTETSLIMFVVHY